MSPSAQLIIQSLNEVATKASVLPEADRAKVANQFRSLGQELDGKVTQHLTIEEAAALWGVHKRHAYTVALKMRRYSLANGNQLVDINDAMEWSRRRNPPKDKP